MADEYKTKALLTDALNVYKHLISKGKSRVRFVTQSMGSGKSNWGNFKPLMVIGFQEGDEDYYVIFTSKFYTDEAGHKTTQYSSIRLGRFSGSGLSTIKYNDIEDFRRGVL